MIVALVHCDCIPMSGVCILFIVEIVRGETISLSILVEGGVLESPRHAVDIIGSGMFIDIRGTSSIRV